MSFSSLFQPRFRFLVRHVIYFDLKATFTVFSGEVTFYEDRSLISSAQVKKFIICIMLLWLNVTGRASYPRATPSVYFWYHITFKLTDTVYQGRPSFI